MKTCFDANILLEALLQGRKKAHVATTVISRTEEGCISPLTAHLYVHFGKKEKHKVADLLEDLQSYQIIDMGAPAVQWATAHFQDNDFEDALQVACAVLDGCDRFVTFDVGLSKKYGRFIDMQLLS